MLEHLLDANFEPEIEPAGNAKGLKKAAPQEVVDAQMNTVDWLSSMGDKSAQDATTVLEREAAREAFSVLATDPDAASKAKAQLLQLKTPAAVRHLAGMLTAYDWDFVEMAKELRGYTVAKLVEETENPNANIRLKALGLLGKVTEVGLFTEKIEVKQESLSDGELDSRIKEKLNKYMAITDAVDTSVHDADED